MKILTRQADVNKHANAVREMSDNRLKRIVRSLGDSALRSNWDRLRLNAASNELSRRKVKRR